MSDPYAHRKHRGRYQPNLDTDNLRTEHAKYRDESNKGMHNYGYHMDQNPEKANLKQAVESHHGTYSSPDMEEGHIHDPED